MDINLDSPINNNTSNNTSELYSRLPHFLLELRGRGVSFSAMDSEMIYSWKQLEVPIDIIVENALTLADECLSQNRPFPQSLASLDRRIRQHLKHINNF